MNIRELNLSNEFLDLLNSRLILIYTGLTRLAKDLLLNVLRNWYGISSNIYDNVQELVKNGLRCANALETGICIYKYNLQYTFDFTNCSRYLRISLNISIFKWWI